MIVLNLHPPPPLPPLMSALPNTNTAVSSRLIAITTPNNYAGRLTHLIKLKGWRPLWCPTVVVESTPKTISSIQWYLSNPNSKNSQSSNLEGFSAIAFTSRTGITTFTEALDNIQTTPLAPHGEPFTVSALCKDSELLDESFVHKLCKNPCRIQVVIPPIPTPSRLVESLGLGRRRKVLCPVPLVSGLEEPSVVPAFLCDLAKMDWIPVRVDGYETRWMGPGCAEEVVRKTKECGLDALVFTSIAEVEGFLKSLRELGLNWETLRMMCPRMLVAAHGPVTASGAERMGVGIDVVSSRFESFDGVVEALAYRWKSLDF